MSYLMKYGILRCTYSILQIKRTIKKIEHGISLIKSFCYATTYVYILIVSQCLKKIVFNYF